MNYPGKFDVKLPVDAKLPGVGLGAQSHGHVNIVSSPHAPSDAIIVSDPNLLLNGDLRRSGVGLIISKDDHELALQDYFRSEKRAALSSPDGAYLTGNIVNALTGHVEYAQAAGAPDAANVIGHIQTAIGSGTLRRACGNAVQAKVGDPVCQGNVIETEADGRLGLRFIDGTGFDLSGGARMVLDEFVCDANGTSHSALFGVTRGTFAFVVGQVAETGCLRIDTPVGSIRGRARTGGIGMVSLTALIFSVLKEVDAAEFSSQRPLLDSLDDDNIEPKDLQLNGTIELFMKKDGRHLTLDDPLQTIVISGSGSISVVTNSATRMAELQRFQQEALAAYAQGTITGPTSTGGGGSSTPPSLLLSPQGLQPINFDQPVPQNLRSATTQSAFVSPTIILEAPAPSKPAVLTLAVITPMVGNSSVNTAHTLNASGASTGFAINGTTDGVENGQIVTVTIVNSSGVAVETFTATVANNGWSVNVSPTNARALSDGSYTVTADVSNALGTATARASQNVTVDQTPPAPPGAALTTDSGSSTSDHITNNGALTLAGIEIGATVEYSTNGGTTWTTLFTPVEGLNTVLVRQTDAAGNVSGVSTLSFTLGTTPPGVTFDTVSFTDTGVQGDHITDNGQVTLSGTASDNVTVSQVQVLNGSQLLGTATVDNVHHTWTLITTLAPGAYDQLNATAIDEAGNPANATTTQTVQVNDAPVLAPISPTLTAITEDQATNVTNPGQTVSSFVGASINDVDAGAVKGIAITGLTSTNGTWQYSIDGGTTWTAIGAVSNSIALLLDASDKIRFLPDGINGGTDTITYRAWDETAGTHGTRTDTSTNGGTTAFSTATDTAHLTVTSVNDAPVATITPASYSATEQVSLNLKSSMSVSDVDGFGGVETVTLSVSEGTLTVTAGSSGAVVGGSGSNTVTVTGTLAQINALLNTDGSSTVSYIDATDTPAASATLTLSINDNGHSGGAALTGSDTAIINLGSVNDAPVATITPLTYSATEQVSLNLKNSMSVSDVDGLGGVETVTLSVSEGTLTVTAGSSGAVVGGSGSNTVTVTGTLAQINALLNTDGSSTVSYIDATDTPSASATLTLLVNDNGHSGGAALTGSDTAIINLGSVNDAPVATITPLTYSATEQVSLNLKNSMSVSDVDGLGGVETVTLSVSEGTLTVTAGSSGAVVGGSGSNTVTVTGTLAQINALLNTDGSSTVSYIDATDTPSASATLTLLVNDNGHSGGAALTGSDTAIINLGSVNDAPVLDAHSGSLSYTENQAATAIDTAIAVSDVDSANLAGATVRITGNFVSGQDVLGFTNRNGIVGSYDAATGVLMLTGQASLAQYQAALQSVTYFNSSDDPSGQTRTISYQVDDGSAQNNLSNVVTATVAVTPVNDAPVITSGAAAARVSEEGLTNGVPDTLPAGLDTTNSTSASGTITATDVDGDALTMSLGTPSASLTSGGVAIAWTLQDAGHTLIGKAGSATIITATITDAGTYNVALSGPIDHSTANQEDNTTFTVPVIVSDGHTTTPTTLSVTIEDDSPKAEPVEVSVVPTDSKTNVMLILDLSGSMGTSSGLTGLTRLDVAKAAISELLDQYDNRGDVMVRIVTFSDTGAEVGSTWQSVADAKAAIAGLSAGGSTNYDAALLTAMGAFTDGNKLTGPGTQNVSYFLSDGDPTVGNGIQANEQAVWESFLTTNKIVSFGLGIPNVGTPANLNPIAFDPASGAQLADTPIIVTDLSQLANTLVFTIPPVTGGVLAGAVGAPPNSFGADGGFVRSITVDGVTYTFNPAANGGAGGITTSGGGSFTYDGTTKTLTVDTDTNVVGGELAMVMTTGAFTFQPPTGFNSESVGFVLVDRDGDTASSTIHFSAAGGPDHPPIVRDDHVITNISGGSGASIVIPDYALLYNDSDADGQTIAITGAITNVLGATSVTHASGNVTFTDNNTNGGSFTYAGSTTSPAASDTGDVTIDRSQTGTTLTGTGFGEILIGRNSTNNTINANEGNDVLIGGTGNDSLTGGAGADMMTGGGGADTFIINSAQSPGTVGGSGDAGTISGYDVITDFATATDTLNLQGTAAAATGTNINGTDSSLTINGQTIKSHTISNGMIAFDDADTFGSPLTLSSTADVAAAVDYLHRNDLGNAGATVAFVANIGGTVHTYVFEQVGNSPNAANDILVDLAGVTLSNLIALIPSHILPAGVSGSPLNLGLTDPADHVGSVTVAIAGVPSGWTLSEGTNNGDGSWTIHASSVSMLSIASPANYTGAMALEVTMSWTNADGSSGFARASDNVEVFAQGAPVFAWSGEDHLTGSTGKDLFVIAQPIGHDTIYSFDAAHDHLDLIGYAGFTSFADIGAHLADDANGDAVITLGDGQSIELQGVHAVALTENNFVFDQTPTVDNAATMTIGNGALLPLSGTIVNTGTIALNSTGNETDLQLIEQGVTLEGGGKILLSDSDANIISGTSSGVTLNNEDNTISGAGQLGNGELTLTNAGTIDATGTHALTIDTGSNLVTNSGVLEASGSGGMMVASGIVNSGVLWANGATLTVQGAVSGNGTATIDGIGTLDFEASTSTNVVFGSGTGGTLKLGDSFHFNGTISGFGSSDVIDLANVAAANASISYHENTAGTGGTLAISDGVQTLELSLLGHYSADNFTVVPDQLHGTSITYVPHDLMP